MIFQSTSSWHKNDNYYYFTYSHTIFEKIDSRPSKSRLGDLIIVKSSPVGVNWLTLWSCSASAAQTSLPYRRCYLLADYMCNTNSAIVVVRDIVIMIHKMIYLPFTTVGTSISSINSNLFTNYSLSLSLRLSVSPSVCEQCSAVCQTGWRLYFHPLN